MASIGNKRRFSAKLFPYAQLLLITILIRSIFSNKIGAEVLKFCRERERLITSDELDEYLVVDAEINATIILECRFCEDQNIEQQAKVWHWQDREQKTELREVDLGMDNNASLNRISVTAELSLVIRKFSDDDAGIYRCFGVNGLEEDNKYNYRLEPVLYDEIIDVPDKGNVTEWENYRKEHLMTVTERFELSRMRELAFIRDAGVSLEVISDWTPWGPCEECVAGHGIKTRRAICRLKRHFNRDVTKDVPTLYEGTDIVQFFKASPILPCRSRLLQEKFPTVSNATSHLPEFLVTEKCRHCKKEKKVKKHKFKYKKRYVLAEGAHLSILCPEATTESHVVWRKDSLILEKGRGHSFRKKDPKHRVLVDIFYGLYLKDVSEDEQGKYTCYVDKMKMMQVKIVVVRKRGLLTEAFVRHMGYLAFILLIASFSYCTGVIKSCRNPQKFKTYEQIAQDEKELKDTTTE